MPGATKRRTRTTARPQSGSLEAGGRYGEPEPVDIIAEDIAQVREPINILLYGPSGHGKTRLAAGAPRATFLTTEKGVVSAKHTGSTAKVWRAPTWGHCFAGLRKAETELGEEEWLIVDSATKMQQLQLQWILETQAAQNSRRDVDLPEVQDHQKWQNQFRRFIDKIYDMPCNTITIATSMIREDRNGDDEVIPELMGGDRWQALSHYMCSQASVVLYYQVSREKDEDGNPQRYLLAQPSPPYTAKDRYSALGFGQYVYQDDNNAMAEFIEMIKAAA
jgi:AAA domain